MKNPTKAQIQIVIDNLTKVLPAAQTEKELNMMCPSLCGTVHCHGGWYYIACKSYKKENWYKNYEAGTDLMANTLGMTDGWDLRDWAYENEEIWGNDSGENMFCDKMAFYHSEKRPEGAKTLADIIEHWKEVKERLPA